MSVHKYLLSVEPLASAVHFTVLPFRKKSGPTSGYELEDTDVQNHWQILNEYPGGNYQASLFNPKVCSFALGV